MKTALHSVSYAGFWPGQAFLDLKAFLAKAGSLGFDGVEIVAKRPHLSVLDFTDDDVRQVRQLLRDNQLTCACLAAYTDFTGGADSAEVPFGEMQVLYLTRLAQMAQILECNLIRVFTSYTRPSLTYADQWQRCVALLRECARSADRYGVNIGIQNHHDLAVSAVELGNLIADIGEPNVAACLDAWAPALQGRDLAAEVALLPGLISFTTVADYQLMPRFRYRRELVNYEPTLSATQANIDSNRPGEPVILLSQS